MYVDEFGVEMNSGAMLTPLRSKCSDVTPYKS